MITTLNKIRAHEPCADGWQRLLRHLGKTQADDEPLPFEAILDSNGLDDALWCLRAVDGHDREVRLYAVWCGRQVQHLMADPRSLAVLNVAERYARGEASAEELEAVRAVAEVASEVAWAAQAAEVASEVAWAAQAAEVAAVRAAWATGAAPEAAAAWAAEAAARATEAEVEVRAALAKARAKGAREAQAAELRRVCREIEAGRDPYPEEEGR